MPGTFCTLWRVEHESEPASRPLSHHHEHSMTTTGSVVIGVAYADLCACMHVISLLDVLLIVLRPCHCCFLSSNLDGAHIYFALIFCWSGAGGAGGAGAVVLPRPLVFSVSSGVLTCLLVRLMVRLLVHLSWFWCHAAGTNAGICCCYPLMPPLVGSRADVGMLLG